MSNKSNFDSSKFNDYIDDKLKEFKKELGFCRLVDAKVTAVAENGILTVKKKGYENTDQLCHDIKNYSGLTISVGDRVSIIIVNNNDSDMRVWQKLS